MSAGGSSIKPGYPTLRKYNKILMQRISARSFEGLPLQGCETVLQTQVIDPNDLDNCIGVTRKDLKEVEQRLECAERRIEELERGERQKGLIVVPKEVQKDVWCFGDATIKLGSR